MKIQHLSFKLGETWTAPCTFHDVDGSALTVTGAALTVYNDHTGAIVKALTESDGFTLSNPATGGDAVIDPTVQTSAGFSASGRYRYDLRVTIPGGATSWQAEGRWVVE